MTLSTLLPVLKKWKCPFCSVQQDPDWLIFLKPVMRIDASQSTVIQTDK